MAGRAYDESLHKRDHGRYAPKDGVVDQGRGVQNKESLQLSPLPSGSLHQPPSGFVDASAYQQMHGIASQLAGGRGMMMSAAGAGFESPQNNPFDRVGGFSESAQQEIFDARQEEEKKAKAPKPQTNANLVPPNGNEPPNGGGGDNDANSGKYGGNNLNTDAWEDKFLPEENDSPDANGTWNNTMYETYGEDLNRVKDTDPHKVWTLVDVEGKQYILNGYHTVNRFGYFITKNEWKDGDDYTIKVD